MDRLWQDVRYAFRTLRNTPAFTLVAVVTLALGIGVNASMFSVIEATILGGLPYPDSDRLVRVFRTSPQSKSWPHSTPDIVDYKAKNEAFESLTAFSWWGFNLAEPGQPAERVQGLAVDDQFFKVLGMAPALGRAFTAGEDRPGKSDVVVLSHAFWTRRFAADPGIVGRTMRFDGRPTTVVGVMPPGAEYPFLWGRIDAWHPLTLTDKQLKDRDTNWLNAIARLKPGVSLDQAQAHVQVLSRQVKDAYGATDNPDGLRVVPLLESGMDTTGVTVTWMCLGLAGFVLLIACANIANLQLARVAQRGRELAVRSALGAGWRHLVRQSLAESVMLGLAGGALGLLVGWWCNDFLGRSIVIGSQAGAEIPLNWKILGFAGAISIGAGVLSGVFPSWMAVRTDVNGALKQTSRSTATRSQHRTRNVLIVAQIALALVLLASSALFLGGLRRFMHRDPGWKVENVVKGWVALPEGTYPDAAKRQAFQDALLDRLREQPGVQSVALATSVPIWPFGSSTNWEIEGRPAPHPNQQPLFYTTRVTPEYFETLGIPLKEGRVFERTGRRDGPRVAIVNETAARTFWPGESAIGKRIGSSGDKPTWFEIVGVVGDVGFPAWLSEPDTRYQFYTPLEQSPVGWFAIVARTSVPPGTLVGSLRQAVAGLDSDLPVSDAAPAADEVTQSLNSFGLAGKVLTAFGLLGLLLAALGIYGVITNVVVQRTSEFGIRVAVGAQVRDILWLVLGNGVRLSVVGVTLGVAGSIALARVLVAAVPSLQSNSGVAVGFVAVALMAVALVATWLPAWRATRVDPLVALRQD